MHLLLHIGPPKTGSTAIQRSLFRQRKELEQAGVLLFPDRNGDLPQRALATRHNTLSGFAKSPLRRRFDTPAQAREWSAGQWQALRERVAGADADLCVISSEHFGYSIDVPALVAEFADIFSGMTVLAYARDPVSLYFSSLQQSLRGGAPLRRTPTPQGYRFALREVIEAFTGAVGRENVVVRNFSRDNLAGGDVVLDFFAVLAGLGKTFEIAPARTNESLPGAALAFLMLVNETLDGKDAQRVELVRRLARSRPVAELAPFRPRVPQAEALIRARAAEDCDWFNRNFLDGQVPLRTDFAAPPDTFGESRWRALIRGDLLKYLTPEALEVLGREMVRV